MKSRIPCGEIASTGSTLTSARIIAFFQRRRNQCSRLSSRTYLAVIGMVGEIGHAAGPPRRGGCPRRPRIVLQLQLLGLRKPQWTGVRKRIRRRLRRQLDRETRTHLRDLRGHCSGGEVAQPQLLNPALVLLDLPPSLRLVVRRGRHSLRSSFALDFYFEFF